MKIQNFVSAIFMAAMLSTMLPLAQAKEKINVSELPDRIVKITMKIFPDATISRAKIVDDHGEYDVYGEFPDSRKFKIDFNDWEIEKIEEQLTKDTIPASIWATIQKASPRCSLDDAKKHTDKELKTEYVVGVKTAEGNKDTYRFSLAMVMVSSTENMTVSQLPTTVTKFISQRFPKSTVKGATRKTRHEKVFFHLDIVSANRSHIRWTIPAR